MQARSEAIVSFPYPLSPDTTDPWLFDLPLRGQKEPGEIEGR